mgnify:FL=1
MKKTRKKRDRRFTLNQVVEAVNYWAMTTVPDDDVKKLLLNKEDKDSNQLSMFNH